MKRTPYQEVSVLYKVYNLMKEVDDQHLDGRALYHFNRTTRMYLIGPHDIHSDYVITGPMTMCPAQLANIEHIGEHLLAIYKYMSGELLAQRVEVELLKTRFIESVLQKYTWKV